MWAKNKQPGFTIVELLIVIVVIGILAAITIVAYSGIQEKARVGAVSSALSQAAKKLALYKVDNADSYPADRLSLDALGVRDSDSLTYQYTRIASTPNTYCMTATTGSTSYKISDSDTTPVAGGCAGHGVGGSPAITNLVVNPSFETGTSGWLGSGDTGAPTISTIPGGVVGSSRITITKADPVGAAQVNQLGSDLKPSTTYRLSFWAWADTPGTSSVILARNNNSFAPFITMMPALTATPTLFTATGMTQGDITQMRLRVTGKTDGTMTYYDGFMITEGSTQYSYADGSSPNWIWNGTANSSTSTGPAL